MQEASQHCNICGWVSDENETQVHVRASIPTSEPPVLKMKTARRTPTLPNRGISSATIWHGHLCSCGIEALAQYERPGRALGPERGVDARYVISCACHVFSRQHAKVRRVSQTQTRPDIDFSSDNVFCYDIDNSMKLPLSSSVLNSILVRHILYPPFFLHYASHTLLGLVDHGERGPISNANTVIRMEPSRPNNKNRIRKLSKQGV